MDDKRFSSFDQLVMSYRKEVEQLLGGKKFATKFLFSIIALARKNEELLKCSPASVYESVMRAAQLKLDFEGMNECHLVPRYNKKRNQLEATFQIGYVGYVKLAMRSGEVVDYWADVVHEKDEFSYCLGLNHDIVHRPSIEQDRGADTHYYCWAKFNNGCFRIVVMTRKQVEEHRDKFVKRMSDNTFSMFWRENFTALAIKTVISKLFRRTIFSNQIGNLIHQEESRLLEHEDSTEDNREDDDVKQLTNDSSSKSMEEVKTLFAAMKSKQ